MKAFQSFKQFSFDFLEQKGWINLFDYVSTILPHSWKDKNDSIWYWIIVCLMLSITLLEYQRDLQI